jgi:hypothetical protein
MNFGLGFMLGEKVFLNARYGFGFNGVFDSLDNDSDSNPKNSVFAASLGFYL